jgi:hypothetical protein
MNSDLINRFVELKRKKRELDQSMKTVEFQIAQVERTLLDSMASEEITRFVTDDGITFFVVDTKRYSINPETKEKFISWVITNNPEILTVNPGTLKSWIENSVIGTDSEAQIVQFMKTYNETKLRARGIGGNQSADS